jgi:molybdenum cofactor cytidylyltransferase
VIGGVVLAAGDGRRFGGPKQLARLRGRPLLEHPLAAMAASGLDRLVVVLGANASAIRREVDLHGAEPVLCPDWDRGQSASLRAGVAALEAEGAEAVVVVLGDQPFLSPRAIAAVLDARGEGAVAVWATYRGVPAHPVVLERELFEAVGAVHGDEGARGLLAGLPVRDVPCDGLGRPDDIDTREQLEAAL